MAVPIEERPTVGVTLSLPHVHGGRQGAGDTASARLAGATSLAA